MGLDVYLEKCSNREEAAHLEKEYERRCDEVWERFGEYDTLTDAQKDQARAECDGIKDELGLVDYGTHPSRERIELDSSLYPDHYFKLGYFLSSYNDGGINSVMRRRGLPGLYDIFNPDDEYEIVPDWQAALDLARDALMQYRAYNGTEIGAYDCMKVESTPFVPSAKMPTSAEDAINVFRTQLERGASSSAYSCQAGTFFLDGMKCVGFIPGLNTIKMPCMYIIYEQENGDGGDWYEHALEIVVETIEYVLAQPDRADYYLIWSS